MIARNAEDLMTRLAETSKKFASLLELARPRALGEVAANDDEVGLELVCLAFDSIDDLVVMGPEMEVGQVNKARHAASTPRRCSWFSSPETAAALRRRRSLRRASARRSRARRPERRGGR